MYNVEVNEIQNAIKFVTIALSFLWFYCHLGLNVFSSASETAFFFQTDMFVYTLCSSLFLFHGPSKHLRHLANIHTHVFPPLAIWSWTQSCWSERMISTIPYSSWCDVSHHHGSSMLLPKDFSALNDLRNKTLGIKLLHLTWWGALLLQYCQPHILKRHELAPPVSKSWDFIRTVHVGFYLFVFWFEETFSSFSLLP